MTPNDRSAAERLRPVSTEDIAVAIFRLHRDDGSAWSMAACREEADRILWYLTHDEAGRAVQFASDASVPEPPTEADPLETVHVVEFSEDGYGLQHPRACRPDLIGCQYNEWLRTQLAPDRDPRRYIMTLANNNPVYTPAPQPGEQEERRGG